MQETPVRYLAQEDSLEKGQATHSSVLGFPGSSTGKESTCNVEDLSSIPELGRSLEKGKADHSSILAWRVSWTVQSIGSQRVGNNWVTFNFLSQYMVTCVSFTCDSLCVFTGKRHKEALPMFKLIFYFFLWFLVTFLYIFHENLFFWMCIMLLNVSVSIYSIEVTLSTSNKYTAVNAFCLHSP